MYTYRLSVILVLLSSLWGLISCQKDEVRPQSQAFAKLYGGTADQQAWDLAEISEGNKTRGYIVVGSSTSFSRDGHEQMYIVKTDEEGNMQHSLVAGDTESQARSVVISSDGTSAMILGQTQHNGRSKLMFVKLALTDFSKLAEGILRPDTESDEMAGQIIEATDGSGYVIVATTTEVDVLKEKSGYDRERDKTDVILMKVGADGREAGGWTRIHGFKGEDKGVSVHSLQNGSYAVLAHTDSLSNTDLGENDNIFLFLTSERGIPIHNAVFGTAGNDRAQNFLELTDGKFALTGISGEKAAWLYTLSADLTSLTTENIGNMGEQMLSIDAINDKASEYVILGTKNQRFSLLLRFENRQTAIRYGGDGDNIAARVISLQSRGFAFCGTVAFGGNRMMGLVRTNERGELKP